MGFSAFCGVEVSNTLTCALSGPCITGDVELVYDEVPFGPGAWISAENSLCSGWRLVWYDWGAALYFVENDLAFSNYAQYNANFGCSPYTVTSNGLTVQVGSFPCGCSEANFNATSWEITEASEDESSSSSSISTSSVSSVSSASSSSSSSSQSVSTSSSSSSSGSSSSSSTSSMSTSSSSLVLANRKGNRLSGRRCCCVRCGEIYWIDRDVPFPGSGTTAGNCYRDGSRKQNILYTNLGVSMILRYGRYMSRVYASGGSSVPRSWHCNGTDFESYGATSLPLQRCYDVDELSGYIYHVGFQSGSITPIYKTEIATGTRTTVASLDSASGPFAGMFSGTFIELRLDTTNDGIYLVGSIIPYIYRMALSGAAPLTNIHTPTGTLQDLYVDHNVAPGYLYYTTGTRIVRTNIDGTGETTIATHASGWLGVEVSLDGTEIYTFRKAGVLSTDYDLVRIDAVTLEITTIVDYTQMTVRSPLTLSF